MTTIDLVFPVMGTHVPTDHGYGLYGAMSRRLPCLHDGSVRFGLVPITGPYNGKGQLQIDPKHSRMRLRLSAAEVPRVLPLAGKRLEVMGCHVRLGVPEVRALEPATSLIARTVAINNAFNEEGFLKVEGFLQSARRQLDKLGIAGTLHVPERLDRNGQKVPGRCVVRIKDIRIVCFSLVVEDLAAEESLRLQEVGIGGRRRMGCGVFLPARKGSRL
jgi:CRISPR-associated protein Cas6